MPDVQSGTDNGNLRMSCKKDDVEVPRFLVVGALAFIDECKKRGIDIPNPDFLAGLNIQSDTEGTKH